MYIVSALNSLMDLMSIFWQNEIMKDFMMAFKGFGTMKEKVMASEEAQDKAENELRVQWQVFMMVVY